MEPSGTPAETDHEPVAANPYGGTPPWQRRGGWKRGLAGVGALVLTAGSIAGVAWLAFRGDDPEPVAEEVVYERCDVTTAADAEPATEPPRLGTPADRILVTVETNYGNLEIMLWGDVAPCGVEAFLELAETGFYSGHDCHRLTTQQISPTAILHCGAPGFEADSDETYGPGWRYSAETGMAGLDVTDALALVTDEAGDAGSGFALIRGQAVTTAGVSVIGAIIDGYEVFDAIAALPEALEYDDVPPQPVTVFAVTVVDEWNLDEDGPAMTDGQTTEAGAPEPGQTPTTDPTSATETPTGEAATETPTGDGTATPTGDDES